MADKTVDPTRMENKQQPKQQQPPELRILFNYEILETGDVHCSECEHTYQYQHFWAHVRLTSDYTETLLYAMCGARCKQEPIVDINPLEPVINNNMPCPNTDPLERQTDQQEEEQPEQHVACSYAKLDNGTRKCCVCAQIFPKSDQYWAHLEIHCGLTEDNENFIYAKCAVVMNHDDQERFVENPLIEDQQPNQPSTQPSSQLQQKQTQSSTEPQLHQPPVELALPELRFSFDFETLETGDVHCSMCEQTYEYSHFWRHLRLVSDDNETFVYTMCGKMYENYKHKQSPMGNNYPLEPLIINNNSISCANSDRIEMQTDHHDKQRTQHGSLYYDTLDSGAKKCRKCARIFTNSNQYWAHVEVHSTLRDGNRSVIYATCAVEVNHHEQERSLMINFNDDNQLVEDQLHASTEIVINSVPDDRNDQFAQSNDNTNLKYRLHSSTNKGKRSIPSTSCCSSSEPSTSKRHRTQMSNELENNPAMADSSDHVTFQPDEPILDITAPAAARVPEPTVNIEETTSNAGQSGQLYPERRLDVNEPAQRTVTRRTYQKRRSQGAQVERVCGDCGKLFIRTGDYHKHVRIHSGEKPYRCTWEGCHFCAGDRSNVARHVRIIHLKLPATKKEQIERGIVCEQDERDYIEFRTD